MKKLLIYRQVKAKVTAGGLDNYIVETKEVLIPYFSLNWDFFHLF